MFFYTLLLATITNLAAVVATAVSLLCFTSIRFSNELLLLLLLKLQQNLGSSTTRTTRAAYDLSLQQIQFRYCRLGSGQRAYCSLVLTDQFGYGSEEELVPDHNDRPDPAKTFTEV